MQQSSQLAHPQRDDDRVRGMLERVEADSCGPKLKAALRLVVRGEPYREAAKQAGLASHQDVYRRARALGLAEGHVEELKTQYRRLASLSNMELEHRLTEDPDKISDRDMIVISGVAADKLARLESQPSSAESPLSRLFEMLHQGGRLEIVGPQGSAAIERGGERETPTIDITPASEPEASQ
jgi:hypothetical protein